MSDGTAVRLLVWDDPDVRQTRDAVLVAEVDDDRHAQLEQLYRWLARRCGPAEQPEACLFTVVHPGDEVATAARVTTIREQGFAVHVRRDGHRAGGEAAVASLSEPMWSMIDGFNRAGRLREVVVGSHDAEAFGERLDALAASGVAVTLLGFRERAGFACGRGGIDFVDLEEIDGLYGDPLPRTNLYDLPIDGRTLPPLRRPETAPPGRASLSMFSGVGRSVGREAPSSARTGPAPAAPPAARHDAPSAIERGAGAAAADPAPGDSPPSEAVTTHEVRQPEPAETAPEAMAEPTVADVAEPPAAPAALPPAAGPPAPPVVVVPREPLAAPAPTAVVTADAAATPTPRPPTTTPPALAAFLAGANPTGARAEPWASGPSAGPAAIDLTEHEPASHEPTVARSAPVAQPVEPPDSTAVDGGPDGRPDPHADGAIDVDAAPLPPMPPWQSSSVRSTPLNPAHQRPASSLDGPPRFSPPAD